jgi:hypothetical protein
MKKKQETSGKLMMKTKNTNTGGDSTSMASKAKKKPVNLQPNYHLSPHDGPKFHKVKPQAYPYGKVPGMTRASAPKRVGPTKQAISSIKKK